MSEIITNNEGTPSGFGRRIAQQAARWFDLGGGASRVRPMEGLRGLAVLLVFFVHFHSLFGSYISGYSTLSRVSQYLGVVGNSGVDLFFLMSGYLIYGHLLRKPIGYFAFMRRRAERLYPVFFVVLGLYLALSVLFPDQNKIPMNSLSAAKYIVQNIFLIPGFFPILPIVTVTWSLSFEWAFYLTLPLFVLALRLRRSSSRIRLLIWFVAWVAFVLVVPHLYHGMHQRMLGFISGIILYELMESGRLPSRIRPVWQVASILGVIGALTSYWATKVSPGHSSMLPVVAMNVGFFFFILHTCECDGILKRTFSWVPLRYWGNFSYSYYLIHGLVLKGVATGLGYFGPTHRSAMLCGMAFMIGLACTWAISAMLFLLIEKPFSLRTAKKTEIRVTAATAAPATVQVAAGSQ